MAAVLVTGASSGIGEACALRLDRAGHRVFAGVRDPAAEERLAAAGSCRLTPLRLDVTDPDQVHAALEHVERAVGGSGLDGLVNNAGIAVGGPVELVPLDEWRRQFEVNLFGQVGVTQAALGAIRRARGRVVFVSSLVGAVALPLGAPYAASKHAVEALAQSLREELRPWGIRVAVVTPGAVDTPIWDKGLVETDRTIAGMTTDGARLYGGVSARLRDQIVTIRTKPTTSPDEVAAVVSQALFDPRPRYRYAPGLGATLVAGAVKVLPERVVRSIVRLTSP